MGTKAIQCHGLLCSGSCTEDLWFAPPPPKKKLVWGRFYIGWELSVFFRDSSIRLRSRPTPNFYATKSFSKVGRCALPMRPTLWNQPLVVRNDNIHNKCGTMANSQVLASAQKLQNKRTWHMCLKKKWIESNSDPVIHMVLGSRNHMEYFELSVVYVRWTQN